VGAKDLTVGPMDAWRAVFRRQRLRPARGAAPLAPADADFRSTLQLLGTVGDGALVLGGVFENLANVRFSDTQLLRSAAALEQLSDGDMLCGRAQAGGNYGLLAYLPLACMGVRRIVGSETAAAADVAWPVAIAAARRAQAASEELLASWRRGVSPAVRATVGGDAAAELLPMLLTRLVRCGAAAPRRAAHARRRAPRCAR